MFICLTRATKDFRYLSLVYAKFNLIVSKLVPLDLRPKYDVNKIEFHSNTKDKTAVLSSSFVVCDFSCPGCGANYICKTQRTLYERAVEHAWTDNNSAVYKHLNDSTGVQHLFDIVSLYLSLFTSSAPIQNSDKVGLRTTRINLVQDNT